MKDIKKKKTKRKRPRTLQTAIPIVILLNLAPLQTPSHLPQTKVTKKRRSLRRKASLKKQRKTKVKNSKLLQMQIFEERL